MIVCALCGKQAKLMQSHIIPKLVYRRIKSHPNSRFRSMDDFKREIQDGEKRPMLCTECEKNSVLMRRGLQTTSWISI